MFIGFSQGDTSEISITLVESPCPWVVFRTGELEVRWTLGKDPNSGGGGECLLYNFS